MADKRLQNILSHLSPPVITSPSGIVQPFRGSASCITANISNFDQNVGHTSRSGEQNVTKHDNLLQWEGHIQLECKGPRTDGEAKLLENLLLSRFREINPEETSCATTSELQLGLMPCRGQHTSEKRTEGHENVELEGRGLENCSGAGSQPKWTHVQVDGVKAKIINMAHSEAETQREGEVNRDGENNGRAAGSGHPKATGPVRSGITSANAASNLRAPRSNEEESLLNIKIDKSMSNGPLSAVRVVTCVFCDIIHGTAPCFKLYEDELCLCILDINPLSFGHSLILPKAHFPCLEATPPQVAAAMCAAVPLISSALLAATRCDSFNMLVNSGLAAGQVIFHTHFHIIPRCKGDGLWQSESATRRPLQQLQEAKRLANLVRSKLSSRVETSAQ